MDIRDIVKATDWAKKWFVVDYTLLSCSLMNEGYDAGCKQRFGIGLEHQFFVYTKDGITCYQSEQENEKFGHLLAKVFSENESEAQAVAKEVKARTHAFREFMDRHKLDIMNIAVFQEFKKSYNEYLPPFIAVNRSANYLDPQTARSTFSLLEETRIFSEPLYIEKDNFLKGVISKIQEREGLTNQDLTTLHSKELENYLQKGKLPKIEVIKARAAVSGMYYFAGKHEYVSAEEANQFEEAVVQAHGFTPGLVKGQTAYPGRVKGKVRIVQNPKGAKFNEGDILVTGMTRPEFVPLMKKAGAIVTDAGGILSHAAIVAREMKKPCVIGTHAATKAFQDGDMVEVDAEKGIVRRISR